MAEPLLDADADDQRLLAQVVSYYQRRLQDSPAILSYLQGRGVTCGQAVEHFRIGYADRTLGKLLPDKEVKAGNAIRGRLMKLGLFRSSGHEHYAGCVVFPVMTGDGTGMIVDVYGRKVLGSQLRKGTPLDLYLGDQRRGVWNVEALAATEEMIVCPSIFDALTFWCQGYRNVTCTFGPDALTQDHLDAFTEFKIKRVMVLSDVIVPQLLEAGIDCFQVKLPRGQSIEAYARRASEPAEALGSLLRAAEWLGRGKALPTMPDNHHDPLQLIEPEQVEEDDDTEEDNNHEDEADLTCDGENEESEPAISPTTSEPPIRTASPLPPAPEDVDAEVEGDEVRLSLGNRRYRIRGWQKNLSFDLLKVNVLVSNGTGMFVDTFDLYSSKQRRAFTSQAAPELHVQEQTLKNDLGRVLLQLEELQDQHVTETLTPKDTTPQMTEQEKDDALRLLRDPHLLNRIVDDFAIVGEASNKLVGYLAAVSRKLDEPLAVVIQSTSAAGKSTLMDAVLAFVPPEEIVQVSAMTGQALYYLGEGDLKHKVLAVVEEEGASKASYALKLLQSEGRLTIASTGKEANTGKLVTQLYHVEGPVMLFLTTTSVQVDEELLNRCLVLTVNEDREQTRAIHHAQRHKQTLPGLLAKQDRQQVLLRHRNAQRLLRPLLVANPYAEKLTFLDDKTRTRRDHVKYLTLIRAVTLLHQHQRPVRTVEHQGKLVEYIDVTLDDIEIANRLAHEVLGRCLDELPPQTRHLLDLIDGMVAAACQHQGIDRTDFRFSQRDVREHTSWGQTQLKVHLRRLVDLEYLLVHRGNRGRSFTYELLYQKPSQDADRFLPGLLDIADLRRQRSGRNGQGAGHGRHEVGSLSGQGRGTEFDATADSSTTKPLSTPDALESVNSPLENSHPSNPEDNHAPQR